MSKFQLTYKAIEDLSDIWNYTFDTWSESQADKYYQELINKCKEISENPKDGKIYEGIWKLLKGSRINEHIVFYREIGNGVIEIERILHQKMDFRKQLNE
ncbi:MAG TPA: type II toxin-antitoxin system RelE/ParE family toxin [Saprospiraceae bacterium]|nr:type II toxin-antitoxin system RelE/ParE family toxin [Saprospiraceae bacterium]HMU03507.1 type II toxin-antitoxin system RelE/ParE family toxin [Saprospiraceae bacterium]